jgi:hypothetical protein
MDKKEAAARAVDAGAVAETAMATHGSDSPQARQAVIDATVVTLLAEVVGCTRSDFDDAYDRRSPV